MSGTLQAHLEYEIIIIRLIAILPAAGDTKASE